MSFDVSSWGSFQLLQIFNIDSGNGFDKNKMTSSLYSDINFVGRTGTNNGVVAVVDKYDDIEPYEAGNITLALGGSIGSCFIQDGPFYTSQNVAVLIPLDNISLAAKHFLATIIRFESITNYVAFARELNAHIKTDFIIKLPIDVNGNPDYAFMENYINGLTADVESIPDYFLNEGYNKACWYMENIDIDKFEAEYAGVHTPSSLKLSDRNWKEFEIRQLFNTFTGGDLIISDTLPGDIPIASHTAENNGICMYAAEIEGLTLFDHNKSISLADRGTFHAARQKEDFYIGTRVKALVFKDEELEHNDISKYAIDFIVTVINHERFRFSYGRNCTNGLDTLVIKLPVNRDDRPDYVFMENYMKSRPFSINV